MKKHALLLLLAALMIYCGTGPSDNAHTQNPAEQTAEAQQGHGHDQEDEGDVLHIPLDKQKIWGLTFHTAQLEDVALRLTLPGVLELNQNRTAQISSFAEGKIVGLAGDLGVRVRKGQRLATINSPEFAQLQADFLKARAALNLSKKEFQRAERLLSEKAIEEKEFLRRQAENEKLATEIGALGSKLHSLGFGHDQIEELTEKCDGMDKDGYMCEIADPHLVLVSPVGGTVIHRDALVGEHVERDKILFTVSDLKILWAQLDAYEEDLPKLSPQSSVAIRTNLYPEKSFAGKVTYISDIIDPKLRTAKIRVEVDNAEGLLKPNMYIQGLVESQGKGRRLILVPEAALQTLNGEKIVFLRREEDEFILRHVKPGEKAGENRIILEGLREGETVVVGGAFSLKAELGKDSRGHDHAH